MKAALAAAALLAAALPAAAMPARMLLPEQSFPSARDYYEPLIADPTELGYGGRLIYPPGGPRLGEITIGDYVGLVRWRFGENRGAQWNLGGGGIGRFNLSTQRNSMEVVDFTLKVPLDVALSQHHVVRLAYVHTSSHLGDDFIARERPAILKKRAFDAFSTIYSWTPTDWFRGYAGGAFAFNQINLGGRGSFQLGAELASPVVLGDHGQFFLAQDWQTHERVNWNGSYNIRGGLRLSDSKHIAAASLFMEYFTGRPYYLQFQQVRESHWGFGLRFEIGNPTR